MVLSFDRRLLLLALTCSTLLVGTALLGWLSISATDRGVHEAHSVQELLRAEQDADMMHHALRADVLAALAVATSQGRTVALTDAIEHRDRASHQMDVARTYLPDLGRDVPQFAPAASQLASYAGAAVRLISSMTDATAVGDPVVVAFLRSFHVLEKTLGELGDVVDAITKDVDAQVGAEVDRDRSWSVGLGLVAAVALVAMFRSIRRQVHGTLADRDAVEAEMSRLSATASVQSARHEFKNRLHDALDMVDDEPDVYDVVRRGLEGVAGSAAVELLIADSSRAHLATAVTHPENGGPGCPVESPWDCVAVRRGQTVVFDSSEQVNACPKLRDRPTGPCSAVCVPVAFMGRALGVLHTTASLSDPAASEEAVHAITVVATETGTRIGTLRALARTQLQAATDGLTGLLNRRTVEEHARPLLDADGVAAVAMADLDHFKAVNDTFGHDAGDRALRLFANALRAELRPQDLLGRYGGEEFLIVMPNCTAEAGAQALDRVRESLALRLADGSGPAFTVSFGVAGCDGASTLEAVVAAADGALREAKAAGRNCVVQARAAVLG